MLQRRIQLEVPHSMFHLGVGHMLPCKKQLSVDASHDQELPPLHFDTSPICKPRKDVYQTSGHYLLK